MKRNFWPRNLIGRVTCAVLLGMPPASWAAPTPAGYDLSWNVVAGGGATFATGGTYSLGATIGQAAAGPVTGGGYALNAGFWQQNAPLLDVDASITATKYDTLTDGLLVIRYLFGITGPALTNNALGLTATRTDPAAIKAYLDGIRPSLDVDGSGSAAALTDGLLIIRYLFGMRGAPLISGAVDPLGTRQTAADIEAYILSLMP